MTRPVAALRPIASSLTTASAGATTWDVLVIGAGPAGSATALAARQAGLNTLLVDRATFPRWKVCGCCINTRAQDALRSLGVGDLLARSDAVPTPIIDLASGDARTTLSITGGMALSRERLDAALIVAAIDRGAAFMSGVDATVADVRNETRAVTLRQGDSQCCANARVVVLATGLADRASDGAVGTARVARGARIGAAVILAPHEAGAQWQAGRVYMAVGRGGYVGAVRLEDDRVEIAASLDPAAIRAAGGPGPLAREILASAGWHADIDLASAAWRGTSYLTRRRPRLGAERLFLVGDAAGYVEPFTGEGMAWALQGGALLGPHLRRAVDGWCESAVVAWECDYHHTFARRHRSCRWVTRLLRRPRLTAGAIHLMQRWPRAGRSVVRSIAPASAEGIV